jgi:hypothetical protein
VAKSDMCLPVYNGLENPTEKYWRLPTTIVDSYKPLFNLNRFNQSISGGGGGSIYGTQSGDGFWTEQGISYLNNTVLQPSFNEFINYLYEYSESHAPNGVSGWVGNVYGTTSDTLANNLIPIISVGS